MKKLFILLGISLVLVLAACGSSDENSSEDTNASKDSATETEDSQVDLKALKSALLDTHVNVANTVRVPFETVNTYFAELANEETEADLEALKEDAVAAADEAISALESFEIEGTEELSEEVNNTLDEAVAEVKGAFEVYKEALENDSDDLTVADEKLAAYEELLTPLYEEAELSSTPNLVNELR